jgi:hypothetical protein
MAGNLQRPKNLQATEEDSKITEIDNIEYGHEGLKSCGPRNFDAARYRGSNLKKSQTNFLPNAH